MHRAFVVFIAVALVSTSWWCSGCGGSSPGGGSPDGVGSASGPDAAGTPQPADVFRVVGRAFLVPAGQAAMGGTQPAEGATVRAWVSGGAPVEATADASGAFTVDVPLDAAARVVVEVRADGTVPWFGATEAAPGGSWKLTARLAERKPLTCQGSSCALDDGTLRLDGLPEGAQGWGRAFDPTVDVDAFPGAFADADGNLLVSSAFMVAELVDANDAPLHTFGAPVTMRLAIPPTTWSTLRDLQPGSGAIEVPMYRFDEDAGQWVRDGQGTLVAPDGQPLAEDQLDALHAGNFDGVVYAQAQVQHMSWWNVDWPVDTHAALRICVEAADGNPAVGATVTARGLTYQGTSEPKTTGADGCACVEVMRSEGESDDVDGDGTPGETHRIGVSVTYAGALYRGWAFDVPPRQGTCPSDAEPLPPLRLDAEHEAQLTLCHFRVRFLTKLGVPIANASVTALPEGDEAVKNQCLDKMIAGAGACPFASTTDDNGEAEVCACMLDAFTIVASAADVPSPHGPMLAYAVTTLDACPEQTHVLYPTAAVVQVPDALVQVDGQKIRWDPPLPAHMLLVVPPGADVHDPTQARWAISSASSAGFPPPVEYGKLPEGAFALQPATGTPAPMQSGDVVIVRGYGMFPDGTSYVLEGQGTAP